MHEGVPLVVSQVNPDDAATHEGIIANPNCSTMQLVPVLMALRDSVGIERVVVDTYQSVSGTGSDAIDELEDQVRAHVAGGSSEPHVYPHTIAFNALPEIDVFLPNGYTKEEWKIVTETRKILHLPDLRVSSHGRPRAGLREPLGGGPRGDPGADHAEPAPATCSRPCRASSSATTRAAHVYPLATEAAGRDEVFVGRVRQDPSIPDGRGLAFWVVSDNLRKGAATNAVEIAELIAARGWVRRASRRAGAA